MACPRKCVVLESKSQRSRAWGPLSAITHADRVGLWVGVLLCGYAAWVKSRFSVVITTNAENPKTSVILIHTFSFVFDYTI